MSVTALLENKEYTHEASKQRSPIPPTNPTANNNKQNLTRTIL